MLSERVYRALLVVYPKEYRREYGELMVQMFRDRMRYDGGRFRGPVIWMQIISDLAVSAIEEHRRGGDMKKRMRIEAASLAALLIIVVGVGVVLSQPSDNFENDELNIRVFVWDGSNTLSFEGKNEVIDVLQQEMEEGVTIRESEDGIELSFDQSGGIIPFGYWEMPAAYGLSSRNEESEILIYVWRDSDPLPREEVDEIQRAADSFARDLNRAVEDGDLTQEEADNILASARHWDTVLLEHWD